MRSRKREQINLGRKTRAFGANSRRRKFRLRTENDSLSKRKLVGGKKKGWERTL